MKAFTKLFVTLALLVCGGLLIAQDNATERQTAADSRATASRPEQKSPTWYKVEITLTEFDDGKKINTRAYTLDAEENGNRASLTVGNRLPVGSSDKFQYIDVNLNLVCRISERQGKQGLYVAVDASSLGDPNLYKGNATGQPIIRRLNSESTTAMMLGKPMLVASIDDPTVGNRKFTVEATVTKINP